jgi:hypothetical protein
MSDPSYDRYVFNYLSKLRHCYHTQYMGDAMYCRVCGLHTRPFDVTP